MHLDKICSGRRCIISFMTFFAKLSSSSVQNGRCWTSVYE